MPSGRDIKRRMRSVKNTQQITRAMEAVSATKMRRSQDVAIKARPYSYAAMEILGNISKKITRGHIFLKQKKEKNICLVVITSDKGLCGSLNGNLLRKTLVFLKESEGGGKKVSIVSVGKYGANFLKRRKADILREYKGVGDIASLKDSHEVSNFVIDGFFEEKYDAVYVFYTRFISTLKQSPEKVKLLPLSPKTFNFILEDLVPLEGKYSDEKKIKEIKEKSRFNFEYKFEPSEEVLLRELLSSLVRAEFYHVILESNASEHSARMVAMKNASENAKELLYALQLSYNKARQASITREISEVTSGAEALKK